jgi:hypothetical protein
MHWISDNKEYYWVTNVDQGHNLPGTWDFSYQGDSSDPRSLAPAARGTTTTAIFWGEIPCILGSSLHGAATHNIHQRTPWAANWGFDDGVTDSSTRRSSAHIADSLTSFVQGISTYHCGCTNPRTHPSAYLPLPAAHSAAATTTSFMGGSVARDLAGLRNGSEQAWWMEEEEDEWEGSRDTESWCIAAVAAARFYTPRRGQQATSGTSEIPARNPAFSWVWWGWSCWRVGPQE